MWETLWPEDTFVEYGLTKDYSESATGEGSWSFFNFVHEVDLMGLETNTTYHYRCGSKECWSLDHTFKTAPIDNSEISFVVTGDSRNDLGEFQMDEWEEVACAAAKEDIDFSLFSGDMVFCGYFPLEWKWFFDAGAKLLVKAPFMVCLGNHEFRSPIFFQSFAMPGNEEWYSFDYSNVHVVVLNTETSLGTSLFSDNPKLFPADMGPGSEQYEWLKGDLSQVPNDKWKIVMAHRPPYSCAMHGNQTDVQPITELFDEYNVDVVFCGHDHSYQRSKPIYAGEVSENGTIYVESAGAGAPLYEVHQAEWVDFAVSCYHYILVEVGETSLTLKAKDQSGEVFDSLTLIKPEALE
jgi:predicted MPP superfamily phosphohydrolase